MLIPQNISPKIAMVLYPIICGLFGLMYGLLYAPAQALLFNYDLKTTIAWIMSGFPFDAIHAIGNLGMGLLIYPLSRVLLKLNKN